MAENQYRVSPLRTDWLTFKEMETAIQEWHRALIESGIPAITISKRKGPDDDE